MRLAALYAGFHSSGKYALSKISRDISRNLTSSARGLFGSSAISEASADPRPPRPVRPPPSPRRSGSPEQGHWEIDYGQVWVPNVVYVRHERYWVNHGGTKVGPFDSKAAAWAWCDNDVDNGGIGGSVIDDSYTTSEDQGHYEQQATGRHWVVDVAGHLG